jgi:3-hydroxybenzoate 6-monooxygenase
MAHAQLPILIAGGGIGGLAAAFVLARSGHAVTVLEQAPEFGEIGAGIQLGPNIFRMFEYLGLTEDINKVAYFPPAMGMRDAPASRWCACRWAMRRGQRMAALPMV